METIVNLFVVVQDLGENVRRSRPWFPKRSSFCLNFMINEGKGWDGRVAHCSPRKCCTITGVSPANHKPLLSVKAAKIS